MLSSISPLTTPYVGWPDVPINVAIGRVPAFTSSEMQIFVTKLQETYGSLTQYAEWKNREIMVSQNVTEYMYSGCVGHKVDLMYNEILAYVPSDVDTVFLRSSELDPDCAWQYICGNKSLILESAFESAVNEGAGLLHYFGTGASPYNLGNFYWARDYEPYGSDFNFSNSGKYPFFMAVSCNLGTTQEPLTRPSVMKDLMFVANGGIIGAFASTIQTTQWASREFSEDFHRLLNVESVNVIGELTKRTKQDFEPRMPTRVWVSRGFILYGDPSMPLSLYQYKDSDITENTTWQGSIVVKTPITVQAGKTLTIKPGTGIFFEPGANITVYGTLEANGTSDFPIVFTRADSSSHDKLYWNGIAVYNGGSFHLDHVQISGARFGVYSNYGSGNITNSHFDEDYFAIYLTHSDNVTVSNNNFINNRYGHYIFYSDPSIRNNLFSDNSYGIMLSRSSPFIMGNLIENSQYDGLYCSNLSSPDLSTERENGDPSPNINNSITNNNRYGVYINYNSSPNLGTYLWLPEMTAGGFNYFDHGSGTYDIKSYNSSIILAEVNWSANWGMNIYGNIDILPTAESLFGPPPLSKIMAVQDDEADSLLMEAYRLETDSAFTEAIAVLNEIITLEPNDPIVYAAVTSIVRNHKHLQDIAGLIDNLTNLHTQYPQTLVGMTGNDFLVTVYAYQRDFDEALARSDEVIEGYMSLENDEAAAWALFEQASIYESMTEMGHGLGRVNSETELGVKIQQTHQHILQDFTQTEAAYFLREMLGFKHPPEATSVEPIPSTFSLLPAYPNPFNPVTTIRFGLPDDSKVSLIIYDILGREVRTLVNSNQTAGYKSVVWDGKDSFGNSVASGVYIYRIVAGNFTAAKKVLLIR